MGNVICNGTADVDRNPFLYIEPLVLYVKEDGSNLKNYMTEYGRISLVRKISKLSEEEYKEFLDIYRNLYLEILWSKGEENIFLNNLEIE